jgi:hypothetical protein
MLEASSAGGVGEVEIVVGVSGSVLLVNENDL